MINNSGQLLLDIKVQDRLREMLATGSLPQLTGVVLGDSDIDYTVPNMMNARISNSPFSVNKIKYPLIYSGSESGLDGYITCFARQVISATEVDSLYGYPPDSSMYTAGTTPPNINNGLNQSAITFYPAPSPAPDSTFIKMGYVLFFQTLLLNYFDPTTGLLQRLNEQMTYSFTPALPAGWEVTIDDSVTPVTIGSETINVYNNSMLIAKPVASSGPFGFISTLQIEGQLSNITKTVTINNSLYQAY